MARKPNDHKLEAELFGMLQAKFPKLTVEVARSSRWDRPCVTFRCSGFEKLLPEERFHRLMSVIPDEFAERNLAGFVWLELAPDETIEMFLELPRSEDVGSKEKKIHANLTKNKFFELLKKSLRTNPIKRCAGNFDITLKVLSALKESKRGILEAKLLFIRHGAYCDCQALTVQAILNEQQKE